MALSGQKTVTTAGASEALGTIRIDGPLAVKALDTNTGKVYIGNAGAGSVSSATGLILLAGELMLFSWIGSLASMFLDVSVNGEGVSWLQLDV